ncbi:tail protein [Actinorhabdospora filicis]|uniref:Tail protein n=1 Tax=Actinorhabdospora filicis TaxID=1785913 RepID=A0A9W6SRT6_9ACTN|nr:macro domain-containing protein [Actinorhabdospora filicis]GLZ81211.1 tail protein [Actinorhabdospora filicis]
MSRAQTRPDVILVAVDDRTAEAWTRAAAGIERVTVHKGSILDVDCDAVVSPANGFGFMDGGLDQLYTVHFGQLVQDRVRERILHDHDGELLVGDALTVATGDERQPWLIAAPTMRVPMFLGPETVNPYLAMRAVLREARRHPGIASVAVPGLGTGTGRVPVTVCARQMRAALLRADRPVVLPASWAEATEDHRLLYTDGPGRLQY